MRTIRHYGDRPQLIFQMNIKYYDGTEKQIVSNTSWKTSESPIMANSIYDGEIYDARREKHGWDLAGYNDKNWTNAVKINVPKDRILSPQPDVTPIGKFSCSNPLFNKIHHNILWGQVSNLFSMPTDCPQRDERMGWMADADLSAEEAIHNFDMAAFYTNWLREIQDDQNQDGSVPDLVPYHKWSKVGTPSWQAAYPIIIWYMHKYYDDVRILEEHYNSLKKWMNYMSSISNKHIITKGKGDWVPPQRGGPPDDGSIPITSTGYYYKSAEIMASIAGILDKEKESVMYNGLADSIKSAFNKRFWNSSTKFYGTGSQTSDAFSLYAGLVPKDNQHDVVNNLVDNIMLKNKGHLWTGILGTKALIEILPEYNKTNILNIIANKKTYPGWGYMISQGATTLWERWGSFRYFNAGMNSLNHIMFGCADKFFYKNIAGIKIKEPAFKKILIKPYISSDLKFAKSSINTIRDLVSSNWKKEGNSFLFDVTILANSKAEIDIPVANLSVPLILKENGIIIFEDGIFKNSDPGIIAAKENGKFIVVNTGSGSYKFELSNQ